MSVDAMARRAQPAILKELAGNPGKRPIKPELPAKGDPVPPKSLSKAAQAVWKRAVGSMPPGVYTTADEPALEAYADAVVTYRRLSAELESAPITIPDLQGRRRPGTACVGPGLPLAPRPRSSSGRGGA
jgi:phage terminase small subunit